MSKKDFSVHMDCPCYDARSEYLCLKIFND